MTARRRALADLPRRARQARPPRAGAGYVGIISGIAVLLCAFLPWYAPTLGPPFSPDSVSGWDATDLARIAAVMGIIAAFAATALVLEERGIVDFDRRTGEILAWAVVVASAVAAVLIAYRLLVLPEPADFLSRKIGVYLAMVAAVGGILSGLALLATRE